ncbi:hypothetical protein BLOT_012303 [Blomia tropicalis]|nr:hypothetical protein BLOT_012303 [Blomia tropicalis]
MDNISHRTKRSKLYIYYSTMGYLFQIVRDIDPRLRLMIDTFTLLGFIWVGRIALRYGTATMNGFYTHIWSRLISINLKRKYGSWAIITGCTDGVGLEYARQLADRQMNLILIGRNTEKLNRVRTELSSKHNRIEIVTIEADLNVDDPQMYVRIQRELNVDGRDIGILVNNAGVMYDSPNRFLDQPESKIWQHVRVNMLAVIMMTRIVLPSMVKRRKGLIVMMGSQAAYQPLPLMGLYSASKVFVEWFSSTLQYEYAQYNIEVQTLVPNYISTKMTGFADILQKPSISFPDASTFTSNAIATIGRNHKTCGYWFHDLQAFFTEQMVPNWAYRTMAWYFLKHIDNTKKR